MNFKINSKKVVLVSLFLVALILVGSAFANEEAAPRPGIGGQFLDSFVCMFTQCGWPAIIIFILPAIAIYVWKKFFSWG